MHPGLQGHKGRPAARVHAAGRCTGRPHALGGSSSLRAVANSQAGRGAEGRHRAAPIQRQEQCGHGEGDPVTDELRTPDHRLTLSAPRLRTRHTHGTGCTLSAAITANLALGLSLPDAVTQAHTYLQGALRRAPGLGGGHGPLGFRTV